MHEEGSAMPTDHMLNQGGWRSETRRNYGGARGTSMELAQASSRWTGKKHSVVSAAIVARQQRDSLAYLLASKTPFNNFCLLGLGRDFPRYFGFVFCHFVFFISLSSAYLHRFIVSAISYLVSVLWYFVSLEAYSFLPHRVTFRFLGETRLVVLGSRS